ncbi:MAG: hypothetical protein K8R67_02610 [Desulfobacteraceae bacterium]|nr:hypothetical protein [Desulfobacteraceae bacterium]
MKQNYYPFWRLDQNISQKEAEALGVSRSRFQGIKERIRVNGDLNLNTPAVERLIGCFI